MNKHQQEGYTLIELLIYISITTLIMVTLTSFVADVTKQATRTKVSKEVQQNARLIITKITQDIRTADDGTISISPDNSQINLGLKTYSWDSAAKTVTYNDGTGDDPLSNQKVSVTNLRFSRNGDGINVALEVQQKNPAAKAAARSDISLSTTVVPRSILY